MTLTELAQSARDCAAEARRARYMKGDEWEAGQWASCHRQWMELIRMRLDEAALKRGARKRLPDARTSTSSEVG